MALSKLKPWVVVLSKSTRVILEAVKIESHASHHVVNRYHLIYCDKRTEKAVTEPAQQDSYIKGSKKVSDPEGRTRCLFMAPMQLTFRLVISFACATTIPVQLYIST